MARKKNQDLRQQASDEARLKYDPQLRTLSGLLAESHANTKTDVTSARAQGAAMEQYIRHSTPAFEGIYTRADKGQKNLTDFLAHAIPATGGGLASGAINSELADAAQRGAGERTRAVAEYAQRGQDALSGALLAQRQAKSAGRADSRKIEDQIIGAAGDKGLYVASRYGDLLDARRQRAITKRGQDITKANAKASRGIQRDSLAERTRHDKVTEANGTGKNKPKSGLGSSTPTQERSFVDSVNQARVTVRALKAKGVPTGTIGDGIVQGYLIDAKGKKLTLPSAAKDAVAAALDLEIRGNGGKLQPGTVKRLHSRGIHVPSEWRPTKKAGKMLPPGSAQGITDAVKGIL